MATNNMSNTKVVILTQTISFYNGVDYSEGGVEIELSYLPKR